nr:acyl-CoA dehydrogenase family protein [Mycobacterium sp.]
MTLDVTTAFDPASNADLWQRISADAAGRERRGADPREQVEWVRDYGLTALTLPRRLGGPGGSIRDLLGVIIDLARADPIVAHILRAHYVQIQQIARIPDAPVQRRWAAEVAAGKIFGNAYSERSGKAGTTSFETSLRPVNGGWSLNGAKFYSTGTAFADWVTVGARLDERRVAWVNIPVDRDGVRIDDDWDGIGQHRTGTGSTTLTNVLVTESDFLLVSDLDDRPVASDSPLAQLYLQAIMAGILHAVVDDAGELIRGRTRTFDHAPADRPSDDPVLLQTIGRLSAAAYTARAAVLTAADDIGRAYESVRNQAPDARLFAEASLSAARVKVHVDETALAASASIFEVGGASSASRSKNLDRHWRNIRTLTLHNPTSYKAVAIGNLEANGEPLPANGYF